MTEEGYRPVKRAVRVGGRTIYKFLSRCRVCGIYNVPYGYESDLRRGKPGWWYCREHKPHD